MFNRCRSPFLPHSETFHRFQSTRPAMAVAATALRLAAESLNAPRESSCGSSATRRLNVSYLDRGTRLAATAPLGAL